MPEPTGSYEEIDGRPVVRFERTFPHPVSAVWEAVTDPAQLQRWFPTTVEYATLAEGEPLTFRFAEDAYPAMGGTFRHVDPPHRLAFSWGEDVLTFELAERADGAACHLRFSVALDAAGKAARDAAGWDSCLDVLADVAAGTPPQRPIPPERWRAYYEAYRQRGLPATAEVPQ